MAVDRKRGLKSLAKALEGGAIYNLTEQKPIQTVSTGVATLDAALGVGGLVRGSQVIFYGSSSSGKALRDDEPVLTNDGWKPIADIRVGDKVFSASGRLSNVVGVFPQGIIDTYTIKFSGGTEIVCSVDHIWRVYVKQSARVHGDSDRREYVYRARDMTTEEIVRYGVRKNNGNAKVYIKPIDPIEYQSSEVLPIHPYLMGCLIGDGNLPHKEKASTVRFTNSETDIVDRLKLLVPDSVRMKMHRATLGRPPYYSFIKTDAHARNALSDAINGLGMRVGACDKFIPDIYKFAPIKDRVELLRGLCDTDGYVDKGRVIEYSTTSSTLCDDVIELVRGLGGIVVRVDYDPEPSFTNGNGNVVGYGNPSWSIFFRFPRTGICPVSSCKHLAKFENRGSEKMFLDYIAIESIEPSGGASCTCIAIDDPSHCYVARDFIPTHNTALAINTIASLQRKDPEAMACIIDIERSVTRDWLENFGVDAERVYIVKEPTIEDAVNAFQECMRASVFDIIVFDSLGAAMRAVSLDGKDGKGGDANVVQVGGTSKAITDLVNKVNGELIKLDMMENVGEEVIKPVVIYINQVRDVIGSRFPMQSMPGGNALHHMASVIVKVHASSATGDKMYGNVNGQKIQVGTRVMCTIEKNKFAPPRRQGGYNFCYQECPEWGFGIDSYAACCDLAIERGVVEARGAWCYYGKEGEDGFVKTQGRNAFMNAMRENNTLYQRVYDETMRTFAVENGVL